AVYNVIVADNGQACDAAREEAERRGYASHVLTTRWKERLVTFDRSWFRRLFDGIRPRDLWRSSAEGRPPSRSAAAAGGGATRKSHCRPPDSWRAGPRSSSPAARMGRTATRRPPARSSTERRWHGRAPSD